MPTVEQILGPFGATVLLIALVLVAGRVISVLWADHLRADADDRAQRDTALHLVEGIIPTLRELVAGQAAINRDAVARHRRDDP